MSNELELSSSEVERRQWLDLITAKRDKREFEVDSIPDMPLLLSGRRSGFILPPDFRWQQRPERDERALIIHIETETSITASVLGNLLLALEKGVKRQARPAERQALRLDVVSLDTGSYFIKVVVPVAGLSLTLGGFVTGVYGTFFNDAATQRPLALAAARIVTEQHANAVTLYSSEGVTLRVDRSAANAYVERRTVSKSTEQEPQSELPSYALEPLSLPAIRGSETTGSGRVIYSEGKLYVELAAREGALVIVEDERRGADTLQSGVQYNLVGHFDTYDDGFPRRFVLMAARPL